MSAQPPKPVLALEGARAAKLSLRLHDAIGSNRPQYVTGGTGTVQQSLPSVADGLGRFINPRWQTPDNIRPFGQLAVGIIDVTWKPALLLTSGGCWPKQPFGSRSPKPDASGWRCASGRYSARIIIEYPPIKRAASLALNFANGSRTKFAMRVRTALFGLARAPSVKIQS